MNANLVMFKDAERRDFPLKAPKIVIGRRSECALRIPTADVSRQHCEIILTDKEITVRDLGSSNGTYVNGKRIAEARLLMGDKLTVGPVTFVLQINGQPAKLTPFDTRPVPAAATPTQGKPAAKKPSDEDETEEILDIDNLDLDAMFDDEDEDDDPAPPRKKK